MSGWGDPFSDECRGMQGEAIKRREKADERRDQRRDQELGEVQRRDTISNQRESRTVSEAAETVSEVVRNSNQKQKWEAIR